MKIVYWTTLIIISYTWCGYLLLLFLVNKLKKHSAIKKYSLSPSLSIIIAACNEEGKIAARIENILAQEYPDMEIIVASDGSTDRTVETAKLYESRGVIVFDFRENRGKASVHNDAVRYANGEIIVFTDAETGFESNFLRKISGYFDEERTGCIVGNLFYRTEGTSISESEGLYWRYEKKLRELESSLGILATASGACMAVKRKLWMELRPSDDSDFITPLDVILQGYRVVYASDAIAYDIPPSSMKGEFKTRIRQTSKNFIGTLKRWGISGCLKHPLISWGILSHKIFRWLSPFFMVIAIVSNIFLINAGHIYGIIFILQSIFYIAVVIGFLGELMKVRIPLASSLFSFCIANIGMGIGVIKGIIGKAPASFKAAE